MNRRTFIKSLTGATLALSLSSAGKSPLGSSSALADNFPDLVAVRGTNLPNMFDASLEALGGLQNFIKKDQTVLIKPNMAWATSPESGANTNPELLAHIIKNVLNAGAKKVYVFDNTCDNWKKAYSESGLETAANNAGATVAPAAQEGYYQEIELPGAQVLTKTKFHELYLEADAIINVPVLKHHGGAKMTAALKNLMGVIWDRGALHGKGLDKTIPEVFLYKKPVLNIVEASRVMVSGGPRGHGDSKYLSSQMLIASADPVAADAAAAKILAEAGISEPGYLAQASKIGIGQSDLNSLNIQRLTI